MGEILWRVLFVLCSLQTLLSDRVPGTGTEHRERELASALAPLKNVCVDNTRTQAWWAYIICFQSSIAQVHVDARSKVLQDTIHLGSYDAKASTASKHIYTNDSENCLDDRGDMQPRRVEVHVECCVPHVELMRQSRHTRLPQHTHIVAATTSAVAVIAAAELKSHVTVRIRGKSTATPSLYIASVEEPRPCVYEVALCSDLICGHRHRHKGAYGEGDTDTDTHTSDAEAGAHGVHADRRSPEAAEAAEAEAEAQAAEEEAEAQARDRYFQPEREREQPISFAQRKHAQVAQVEQARACITIIDTIILTNYIY
jgi:hypothetical protein